MNLQKQMKAVRKVWKTKNLTSLLSQRQQTPKTRPPRRRVISLQLSFLTSLMNLCHRQRLSLRSNSTRAPDRWFSLLLIIKTSSMKFLSPIHHPKRKKRFNQKPPSPLNWHCSPFRVIKMFQSLCRITQKQPFRHLMKK